MAQNVEAFDACGKKTHGTFICARAHTKKHSALERLSCLQSVFLRLSNARCFMIHSIRWRSKDCALPLKNSLRSSRNFKSARTPLLTSKSARIVIPTNFYADELIRGEPQIENWKMNYDARVWVRPRTTTRVELIRGYTGLSRCTKWTIGVGVAPGSVTMACWRKYSVLSGGTWLPPEQGGVSRWIVPPVQLAPALPPVSLCLWPSPQCRACTLLCSGRSTIPTPQSHSRLDGHFVVRSGQQRWCGASTFTTIWRDIAPALSQHRRPGSTGYRSVWLLGVTSRACIVRCKGVQSLCSLVCDFTDRHYVPTPWTGQSAGVWAAGAWDRAGLFHTARLLGHRWHGPASESVLQEAVWPASRPAEGQLQPYDCSCAGDAQLFFAAWCNSKLARCSIGEGALRPLCDVCRRCGRWVPRSKFNLFAFFLFFFIFCFFFFLFSLPGPVVYLFRLLFLLYTSCLSSPSLYYYSLFSYSPPFILFHFYSKYRALI